jgi:hypothetical protein
MIMSEMARRKLLRAATVGLAAGALGTAASKLGTGSRPGLVPKAISTNMPVLPALKCAGPNFVNASTGATVFGPGTAGKGFVVQAGTASATDCANMVSVQGSNLARVIVFWNSLQPGETAPSSGTDYSEIDMTWVTGTLDPQIANLTANGIYVLLCFYWSPNQPPNQQWPVWLTSEVGSGNETLMSSYVSWGESATHFLANRYGPSGAMANPGVIGMGLNEVKPDSNNTADWLTTHYTQQGQSMMTWMRAPGFAPGWIADINSGYGANAPYANASGTVHSTSQDQVFTTPSATWADPYGGNYFLSLHDYLRCVTTEVSNDDGRDTYGFVSANAIRVDNTAYMAYPPSGFPRMTCQGEFDAYVAPYLAFCGSSYANVPLGITESGFVPQDGSTTFSGPVMMAEDKVAAWVNGNAAAVCQWDFRTSASNDIWACEPGAGYPDTGSNGWQDWTNTVMSSTL